jgi:DNA polymerase (family 10)
LTDHAENLAINGLSRDRVLEERAVIEEVRSDYESLVILHGAELNIDPDGGLDYDDDFLKVFDFTVASVHSHFDLDTDRQTERLVEAARHPAVNVIGHPSGRKIGMRPGIRFDITAVGEAAAAAGTALEINSHLQRLDLSASHLRTAIGIDGLMFSVSTDAHHVRELANRRWGVAQARKGGVSRSRVVNSLPINEFLAWMGAKGNETAD